MAFAVSSASVDITPTGYALMGGYGTESAPRQATGTYSPLTARCVVFWDDGSPNVLVSADLLGLGRPLNQAIRAGLNLPTADLVLLTSHTHNGPVLPDSPDPVITYGLQSTTATQAYADWLRNTLIDLVNKALLAPRTTVTLDYQVTSQSFARNRAGLGYTETAVPVLVARAANGLPRAVLFSYGCHPVSAGNQTRWDGDYPAAASAVVEAAIPGCTALYVPGPAGDQNPNTSTFSWAVRNRLGAQLGSAVVTAASTTGRPVAGPLSTSYAEVNLPLDVSTSSTNLAAVRAAYVNRRQNLGLYAWYRRHADAMIAQIDAGTYQTSVAVPLQVWKLTGTPTLRMAFTGGELVSGYAAYFRNQYNGANGLMIGGYANECRCYLPSNEFLPPIRTGGSYEGGWDTDHPGIAGGSMTIYARLGHFRAGTGGAESMLISALNAQLA